jgi:hypothetical protein
MVGINQQGSIGSNHPASQMHFYSENNAHTLSPDEACRAYGSENLVAHVCVSS